MKVKNIIGILFFVSAVLLLIGSVANGTLGKDYGNAAYTYGRFTGDLIPIVIYVFSGIFFFNFNRAYKTGYAEGARIRAKQCTTITVFTVIYAILTLISYAGALLSEINMLMGFGVYMLTLYLAMLPYVIPLIIFAVMQVVYVTPYKACRKNFGETLLSEHLSASENFRSYSKDEFVFANEKILFFPKLFCIIPIDRIESVKLKKVLFEQNVYIYLTGGKKIVIYTRQYENIMTAINAHKNCL